MRTANYTELVKNNQLDIWVCLHFKVLPTDEKFKSLRFETKMLLLTGFMELPTPEQMKMNKSELDSTPRITGDEERNLKKLGYTSEAISRMRQQLDAAGLT